MTPISLLLKDNLVEIVQLICMVQVAAVLEVKEEILVDLLVDKVVLE